MDLAQILATNEYVRQRLEPTPGDPDYLLHRDLLEAIKTMAPSGAARILDYGCGGSPYRTLFPGAVYHRADLVGGEGLDFEFAPDSMLPAHVGGYDFVLSSQVLEHVAEPADYLAECLRVLEPGGRLLVTTHGTYWDHACPYDYWRWTGYGLRKIVEAAGFETMDVKKITTGTRAALYLFEQKLNARFEGGGWYGELISRLFALIRRLGAERRHCMADKSLVDQMVVDADGAGESALHSLYIDVAILARKPLPASRAVGA